MKPPDTHPVPPGCRVSAGMREAYTALSGRLNTHQEDGDAYNHVARTGRVGARVSARHDVDEASPPAKRPAVHAHEVPDAGSTGCRSCSCLQLSDAPCGATRPPRSVPDLRNGSQKLVVVSRMSEPNLEPAGGACRGASGRLALTLAAALLVAAACGGDGGPPNRDPGSATPRPPAEPPTPGTTPGDGGAAASAITPQVIALGDSIFHGQVAGGTCALCHGQDAQGGTVGPNLRDAEWIHGDGSFQFIISIVTSGVTSPKKSTAPMLPMGGTSLTPAQVRAVAAYVVSLSPKK